MLHVHRRHLLDIERPGSRKLGDLLIFPLAEHSAHLEKHLLKAQVLIRCLVIRVKNLQHGGCAVIRSVWVKEEKNALFG
jgi:hypothetical protein